MTKRIAVIGAGASAVLLLAHMARISSGKKNISIDIYDRSGTFGKGVAYATDNMSHPLNVRAANMSGYADDKDDLVQWLSENAPEYTPLSFIPRALYARYLSDILEDAKNNLSVRFIHADVTTARKNDDGIYEIVTAGGAHIYDDVVQATGNARPLTVLMEENCQCYYSSPYGFNYNAVSQAALVSIIGSGLSCVDAIMALHTAGFHGKIQVFSRGGRFPARHVLPGAYEGLPKPFPATRSVSEWMKEIRMHVDRAVDSGLPWQTAIDSLRPDTNIIWQSLTPLQRSIFLRHGLSLWNTHRHRMPEESADVIENLISRGAIAMMSKRVARIKGDGAIICHDGEILDGGDAIINALGYRYDEKGRSYDASYKIGPANFGDLFETTAIPEIRAQASSIAQKLIQ